MCEGVRVIINTKYNETGCMTRDTGGGKLDR